MRSNYESLGGTLYLRYFTTVTEIDLNFVVADCPDSRHSEKILLPYLAKTPTPRNQNSPPSLPIASPDDSVTRVFRRKYCTTQVSGQFLPSRHVRTGCLRAMLINITPSILPESIGTGEALHSSDNESIGA
nr:hypothetical protein CFP56_21283 [Quercus suber]